MVPGGRDEPAVPPPSAPDAAADAPGGPVGPGGDDPGGPGGDDPGAVGSGSVGGSAAPGGYGAGSGDPGAVVGSGAAGPGPSGAAAGETGPEHAPGEAQPVHATGGLRGRASRIRRRRSAVLAGMGALTVVGVGLAVTGLSNVRSSTVGRYEEVVGSDEPGHLAYVVPTPTMGVLHRGADGELVGAALLALEPGDAGGAVVVVPPATLVPGAGDGVTLADVYADEGAEAAAQALGLVVTAAVTEHVELDDDLWAQLVEPVGAVELRLDQAIGRWDAGEVTLEPDDVGPFLAARTDTESDLGRLERQQAFWSAWLPLVEGGGEDALPGEASSGIGRFVRAVAHGDTVAGLPVARDDTADEVRFVPDAALLGDLVAQVVPYPTSPEPGGRVRVRLLSGTGDADEAAAAAQALVAGGAEIVIIGNAPAFDVGQTTLVPSDADREALARWLQANAVDGQIEDAADGLGGIPPDDEIDVTVILGQDAGDLMRR